MLNEWLRKKLPDEYCEHAAAGVSVFFHGEYETGCAGNCGGAGTRPVTADDLFNLGSLSKVYCAAIIMKLHEEGLIDLDAPVCRYLPEFAVRRGRYGKITVRMLLNHSSGMSGTMYRGAMLDREHRPDDAGFLRWLSQNSLKAEPGAYSVYCNDGFQLAGMLAARAGSATEQELLAKWITEPIGAVTTRFGRSDPEGTEQIRAEGCRAEYPMAGGAGGIVSRVGDLARFGAQFLDGGYILSRESVQEMIAPQGRTFLQNDGYSSGFGLGWDFTDYRPWGMDFGKGTVGKSGSTFQFSSFLLVSREHDFCAAVSGLSYSGFSAARLTAELAAEMLPATKSIRQTTPPDKTPGGEICGYYSGDGGLFRIRKTAEGFLRADYRSGGFENEASTRAYFESNLCCGSEELGFEEYQGKFFAYKSKYGVRFPFAQQLVPGASVPDGWKARTGRHYIACNRSFLRPGCGFPLGRYAGGRAIRAGGRAVLLA
jgi:CubicO group peptidase (beta-lactamase class C family)